MSFLNPILLFGAASIAVPIIIHLLNKRKYEKVTWAAMRFLMAATEQNQRRMRVEDLLLLLLRCALLVLLALALARPAFPGTAGGLFGRSGVTACLVLDNSYSMGLSDGVTTRFENAKKALESALDSLPSNSSAAVLLANDGVEAAIAQPTLDLNLARKIIRDAKLSDRASNVVPALRAAMETLKKKPATRREMYFATDDQALGWRQFETATGVISEAKNDISTTLLFVGPPADQNMAVADLRLTSGLPVVDRPLRFEAKVTNFSLTDASNIRVRLLIDGSAPSDQSTIESLSAGQSKSVSLFARLHDAGTHTVTAVLDPDRLPNDDQRTTAVRVTDRLNVLLVNGSGNASSRSSDVFYLQNALSPLGPSAENYFIKTTAVSAVDLGSTRFDNYDAVILANVADLPAAATDSLSDYVKAGGGLIVFPGPAVESTANLFYNEQLYTKRPMLPSPLGTPVGDAKDEKTGTPLQSQNFEHPIATLWNDANSGSLADVKVRRFFPLNVNPQDADATTRPPGSGAPRVVLKLADGRPFMMERTYGGGRVVLFGSTANTVWSDMAVRPGIFVPLLYRTLGSLVSRQDDALNIPVGATFSYRTPLDWLNRDATVLPPGANPDAARSSTKSEMVENVPMLRVNDTGMAGGYTVDVSTEPPTTLRFAAQFDPAESNLNSLASDQEKALASNATVIRWAPGAAIEDMAQKARVGTEFWWPLAIIALAIAASETFLAQWFSRPK